MNWEGAFATTLPEDAHKNGEVRSIVRLSCEARDHGPSAHSSIPPMNTDVVDGGVLMNVGWRDRKRWTVRWRSKDEPYRGERAFKRKRGFVRKPGRKGLQEKKRVRTETGDGPGTPWGGATIPDKKLCARLAKVPTTRKNVFEDANLGVVVETACRQIPDDVHQFDLTD